MKDFCTQCNGSTRHANKCIVKQLDSANARIKALEALVKRLVKRLVSDIRSVESAINPMDYL